MLIYQRVPQTYHIPLGLFGSIPYGQISARGPPKGLTLVQGADALANY